MNMEGYQLEWVLNHLGHTKKAHTEHYRQMSSVIERVNVGKQMLIHDLNLTSKFAGESEMPKTHPSMHHCKTLRMTNSRFATWVRQYQHPVLFINFIHLLHVGIIAHWADTNLE